MGRKAYEGEQEWTEETEERLVTLEVDFTVSAWTPAQTQGDPSECHEAEGGEIELGEMRLVEVEYYEGADTVKVLADMTSDERAALLAEYRQRIDASPGLQKLIELTCLDGMPTNSSDWDE
jgi:hypothetical protein